MEENTVKIFIVLPSFDTGGAQQFVLNLCSFLVNKKIDVTVIALRRSKNQIYSKRFRGIGVNIIDFEKKRVSYSFFSLRQYIKSYKPNVVISTVHNVDLLLAITKFTLNKFKLVIRKASFPYKRGIREYFYHFDRIQNLIADKIIVLTQEMYNYYIEKPGIDNSKIEIINNMVDKDNIYNMSLEEVEEEHLFNSNEFNLISVGRLVFEKGYDILLRAFLEVKQEYKDIKLVIVGDGYEKEKLIKIIKENDIQDVYIIGFKQNPYKYIARADLFVLSSRFEGFPNVILEAIACKTPVLATKCKTGPTEIITNRFDGFLVRAEDSKELKSMIKHIYENRNLLKKISDNASDTLSNYSVDIICQRYLDSINKL